MNTTSMLTLRVDEMPAHFKNGTKNAWSHKIRLYDGGNVKAERISAELPGVGAPSVLHPYYDGMGNLVGFLDYYLEEAPGFDHAVERILHIGYINVRRDYQHQGIAWQMVAYVIAWTNCRAIEWGPVMNDYAAKIVEKAKRDWPNLRHYAKMNPR